MDDHDRLLGILTQKVDTLLDNQRIIKDQVIKTNGRVTSLEKFEYTCKGVIAVIVIFLLPLFLHIITKYYL